MKLMDPFKALPSDTTCYLITNFLECRDLTSSARVSKLWNEYITIEIEKYKAKTYQLNYYIFKELTSYQKISVAHEKLLHALETNIDTEQFLSENLQQTNETFLQTQLAMKELSNKEKRCIFLKFPMIEDKYLMVAVSKLPVLRNIYYLTSQSQIDLATLHGIKNVIIYKHVLFDSEIFNKVKEALKICQKAYNVTFRNQISRFHQSKPSFQQAVELLKELPTDILYLKIDNFQLNDEDAIYFSEFIKEKGKENKFVDCTINYDHLLSIQTFSLIGEALKWSPRFVIRFDYSNAFPMKDGIEILSGIRKFRPNIYFENTSLKEINISYPKKEAAREERGAIINSSFISLGRSLISILNL